MLFLVIILVSCNKEIETEVFGYLYIKRGVPAENVEIGDVISLSPRDHKYYPIQDVVFGEDGKFYFQIKKRKINK